MAVVGSVFTRRQWIRPLMIHRILVLTAVIALGQAQMAAQIRLTKTCTVHFATPEQGKSRLAKNDAYIKGLSPFERAAKIQKAGQSPRSSTSNSSKNRHSSGPTTKRPN